MKMRILLLLVGLFLGSSASAQILQWNTAGNSGNETTEPSVFNDPNVAASSLTLGSGITSAGNTNRFGGNGWSTSTLANAISGNRYIQFTATPNSGNSITPTSLVFRWESSGSGPNSLTLRSSVDGYASDLGTVTGTQDGTTNATINIVGIVDLTTAVTFRLYGYGASAAGGTGGFDTTPANTTPNVTLNGTVNPTGPYSVQTGDWNDASTWSTNAVPLDSDNVRITAGHIVHTTTSLQRNGTTTVNGTFELQNSGFAQGTNFTYGSTGGLNFNTSGVYGINNNHVYWPATNSPFNVSVLQGGIQMNSTSRTVSGTFVAGGNLGVAFGAPSVLTLNGICRIDPTGHFLNSPIYGNASELIYNTGGTFGRGFEWLFNGVGTIGTSAGYPNDVRISANTILNYNNGTPQAKSLARDLTVDSGSHLNMNVGASSNMPLTVGRHVVNNGTITLGNVVGADLRLAGNFTNAGTFNGNGRAVSFAATAGTQTVSSTTPLVFPYVVFHNNGNRTVQLLSNLTVSAPNGGDAISFNSNTDFFALNNQSLTIGTPGVANAIAGIGFFDGTNSFTTTSSMTLRGTGPIGTLRFSNGFQNLASLVIDRTSAATAATLGSALRVQSTLMLTNGRLDIANSPLTLGPALVYTGNNQNYIIADRANGANANVQKIFSAQGSFTFPIGDRDASADGSQYSPVTVVLTGGGYSGTSFVRASVNDIKPANLEAPTDHITRYWDIGSNGLTPTTFTASGTYLAIDVNTPANEATYKTQHWNGTVWTSGALITPMTTGPIVCIPASTNFITAGIRAPDINVRGVINPNNPTIVSGDMVPSGFDNTEFAAQTIGNPQMKPFRIENVGDSTLNVSALTLTGANAGDFNITASAPYSISGPTGFIDFTITFQPTAAGLRTAIVSIASNDPTVTESPYTFMVQGVGECPVNTNTVTPTSGPAGTLVTIDATTGNLSGASVTFNGISAVVNQISATQITAIVPVGAVSGPIITTNASGCSVSTTFGIIRQVTSGCQGGSALPSSLFISQVTDSGTDGMSYIEIYNGTGAAVNLNGWTLRFFNNGSSTQNGGSVSLSNVVLSNNSSYTVVVGSSNPTCNGVVTGGNGELANQTSGVGGINFNDTNNNNGHDHIRLFNGGTHVDSWGVFENQSWAVSLNLDGKGANFERKNNVVAPNTTYTNADWNIADWGDTCTDLDYSNLNTFDFLAGTPPTVTLHPTFVPTCKETTFTVDADEGFTGGNGLAYQWYEVAPGTTTWTQLANGGVYSGVTTETLTISNITGLEGYQYYAQIRENGATCFSASNAVRIEAVNTVTWNGTNWAPSAPTSATPAIIDGTYNTSTHGSFECCSLAIGNTRTLTIAPNTYVSIVNDLTVATGGNLQVQDDGSLVMIEDDGIVTNNGTTQVSRQTTPFRRYDYTYWSSPVANATLGAAMPGWRYDYSWTFNTANYSDITGPNGTGGPDGFDDNNDTWVNAGSGAAMIPAKGYTVMGPTNLGAYPALSTAIFSGAVNNGVVTIPLALSANSASNTDDFNLIGNPYPSAIFADDFINLNTNISGTLTFWTHSTPVSNTAPGPYQMNFVTTDYAMYNLSGGVVSNNGGAEPTGYVASGQGFFVEAEAGGNLVFNNSMRDRTFLNDNFYRSASADLPAVQKDRIWLNFEHAIGLFSQSLICYTNDATPGIDRGYDGIVRSGGNAVSFYSFIDDGKYRIQGRSAFTADDIVPLGMNTRLPGTYTITIGRAEGMLNEPSVPVFLEDKLLNIFHDLKQGPYSFEVNLGATDDRFQLRYTDSALGNPDVISPEKQLIVVSNGDMIKIRSGAGSISQVEIFDMLGRKIYSKLKLDTDYFEVPVFVQEQALLVRVTLADGTQAARKITH